MRPILRPAGGAVEPMRAVAARPAGGRLVELDELDLDLAVHAQRELVVARGSTASRPRRDRLDHVLEVLGDGDPLPRLRPRRDLEHVGEHVVLRIVVDDLDAALVVVGGEPKTVL